MEVREVQIHSENIELAQFLKWAGIVSTGGQAKQLVASGSVMLNGIAETARGKKLRPGDIIEVAGKGKYRVTGGERPGRMHP